MAWLRSQTLENLGLGFLSYSIPILVVTLSITWFLRIQRKVRMINQVPGPKCLPILGNALEVIADPMEHFRNLVKLCAIADMVRVWVIHLPYIFVSGPRAAEDILSNRKQLTKSHDYLFLRPWIGTGLLNSTDAKWRFRRKMITPAFHFNILEDFLDVFNAQSNKFVQKLRKNADGKPFDIYHDVSLLTLDILCETAMGCSVGAQDNEDCEYVKAAVNMSRLVCYRMTRAWLYADFMFRLFGYAKEHDAYLKTLHDFSYAAIRRRREAAIERKSKKPSETTDDEIVGKKKKMAFLDLLLEFSQDGKVLSDEDIREEVDTFMFGGHDTTASSINWLLYLLGTHQDIQAKVHEELDAIFQKSDRPATMEDLREMKYFENCIKESLRLFPSVALMGRELTEETVVGNYRLPAGAIVMVFVYSLHRDPEQFPNPEVFDPDRFLPENCKDRHPYAYVPFSAGPRNCIGQKYAMMKMKITVSTFLRSFRVETDTKREDLQLRSEVMLRPNNGNTVKLFCRE